MPSYHLERHDQDDGSITYEIWDYCPENYRRLCSLNDLYESTDYSDNARRPKHCAKSDAEMITKALNLMELVRDKIR